jgi:hypothetical protein
MAMTIRKLSSEEARQAFPRRGQQDVAEYTAALRELGLGEAAGIARQGLPERALKRRLGRAAKELGYRLKWSRQASQDTLYFQVIGTPPPRAADGRRRRRAPPPEASAAPPATTARRGRRRGTPAA